MYQHASYLQRLIAWVIDNVLIFMFAVLLGIVFSVIISISVGWGDNTPNQVTILMTLLTIALLWVLQFLYFGVYWSGNGSSLGMTVMGIRVIRRNGVPLSTLRSGLRGTLGYALSAAILGLGYIWAFFDPDHETLHDKLFDTQVVQVETDLNKNA
jgi:uncharacterized RDD family membrane protein YckC